MKGLDNHISNQLNQYTDKCDRFESETLEIKEMIKDDLWGCIDKAGLTEDAMELFRVTLDECYSKSVWEKFEAKLIDKLRSTP